MRRWMMMQRRGLLLSGLLIVALALDGVGFAVGRGAPVPSGRAESPGSTSQAPYPVTMMGSRGMGHMWTTTYPGGMMGYGTFGTAQGQTLALAQAEQAVHRYIAGFGQPSLALDELLEFQDNVYAIVADKSTGHGAFEVLVSKTTGAVFPEYGPAMMWNTQYGMMGAMLGYQRPSGPMTVTPRQATRIAQQWLARNQPGSPTEPPDQFPGYYTLAHP